MIDRIEQIKTLLKNGSIQQFVGFGSKIFSEIVPYCVVVPTSMPPNREAFQIWAHFHVGQERELETYVKEELPALMSEAKNSFGAPLWETNGSYDGVTSDEGAGTIRAGKVFYLPLIIY